VGIRDDLSSMPQRFEIEQTIFAELDLLGKANAVSIER